MAASGTTEEYSRDATMEVVTVHVCCCCCCGGGGGGGGGGDGGCCASEAPASTNWSLGGSCSARRSCELDGLDARLRASASSCASSCGEGWLHGSLRVGSTTISAAPRRSSMRRSSTTLRRGSSSAFRATATATTPVSCARRAPGVMARSFSEDASSLATAALDALSSPADSAPSLLTADGVRSPKSATQSKAPSL
jgi:hypothetical protein